MRTLLVALLFAAAPAFADERLDGGQKHAGFALELHLGTRLFDISGAGNTVVSIGALQGGIFAGYKISRVIFGIGFDIARVAQGTSNPDTSQASTAILFSPGVRIAIVRSADQRVEMFGQFDIGFGTTVQEQSPGTPPNRSNFHLSYDLGPGVRFWAHPHFAVSGVAGINGEFNFNSQPVGTTTTRTSNGVTAIFAALQLLGVF